MKAIFHLRAAVARHARPSHGRRAVWYVRRPLRNSCATLPLGQWRPALVDARILRTLHRPHSASVGRSDRYARHSWCETDWSWRVFRPIHWSCLIRAAIVCVEPFAWPIRPPWMCTVVRHRHAVGLPPPSRWYTIRWSRWPPVASTLCEIYRRALDPVRAHGCVRWSSVLWHLRPHIVPGTWSCSASIDSSCEKESKIWFTRFKPFDSCRPPFTSFYLSDRPTNTCSHPRTLSALQSMPNQVSHGKYCPRRSQSHTVARLRFVCAAA